MFLFPFLGLPGAVSGSLRPGREFRTLPCEGSISSERSLLSSSRDNKRQVFSVVISVGPRLQIPEAQFPASVSTDTLLSAGKLVQPTFTRKAVLNFEHFEIETGTWKNVMTVECKVESAKFSFFSCSTNIPRGLSAYKT